jgi:hypothetical protein
MALRISVPPPDACSATVADCPGVNTVPLGGSSSAGPVALTVTLADALVFVIDADTAVVGNCSSRETCDTARETVTVNGELITVLSVGRTPALRPRHLGPFTAPASPYTTALGIKKQRGGSH